MLTKPVQKLLSSIEGLYRDLLCPSCSHRMLFYAPFCWATAFGVCYQLFKIM